MKISENDWPTRWWEPGCEDMNETPAPEEETEMDLPF